MINKSELFDLLRRSYSFLSCRNPFNYMLPPIRYFLELTYRCNLRCPFCFINKDRTKNEMTAEEWFKIIEQIPPYSFISLVAGEVMIREDFIKIMEKSCRQTFGKVSLITNGILLNEAKINKFIDSGMLLLSVSLDGYGEIHDKIRNHAGLYNHIQENLMLLKKIKAEKNKKRPLLDIKSVILKDYLDELPKIYKAADKFGAEFYSLSFKRNNYLRQNSELKDDFDEYFYKKEYPLETYFDKEHFIEVYKELESLSLKLKTKLRWAPKFSETDGCQKILDFFEKGAAPVSELYKQCEIPFSSIFITPEGNVYPCLSVNLGNVRNTKIQKVINSEKYKEFRRMLKKYKIFNACQLCCDAYPRT